MFIEKKYFLFLISVLLVMSSNGNSQTISPTNLLSEGEARNTQIFYFNLIKEVPPVSAKDFFKPYLAYLDTNNNFREKMMDAFLFLDLSYKNNGMYEQKEWNNYLDNIFLRTKLPVRNTEQTSSGINNFAVLGNYYSAGLSYKTNTISNKGAYTVSFDIKTLPVIPHQGGITYDLLLGVEFFDADGKKILPSTSELNYSSALNMHYKYINFDETTTNVWQPVNTSFNLNINCESIKVHVLNWGLDKYYKLGLDNFFIKYNAQNFINTEESRFDYNDTDTNWEYNKNSRMSFLFNSRTALINELHEANLELAGLDIPETKLILEIPEIGFDIYSSDPVLKQELKRNLINYIEEIYKRYNDWVISNPQTNVKLIGLYYLDENIRSDEVAFYKEIFEHMKQKMNIYKWKLYGSPYNSFYSCDIISSYADGILPVFDMLWQQPNAFYLFRYGNMGPDMLQKANALASNKKLAINIENRVLAEGEEYGRINDYFDYGTKYGFANYSKLYYDDSGSHFVNCHSDNPKQRIDYDNLYKFIKQNDQGIVVNGDFEIKDETNLNKLHYWDGNYAVKANESSVNKSRLLEFSTETTNSIYSVKYPVIDNRNYKLTLQAKESQDDKIDFSAVIGVKFYDKSLNLLSDPTNSNLAYSNNLESYYKYIQTSKGYNNFEVSFTPPANTVYLEFFIKKLGNSAINWRALMLTENNLVNKSQIIYQYNDSLHVEQPLEIGNKSISLLTNNFAVSKERIPVLTNKEYKITVSVREETPVSTADVAYKALLGIELFDENGVKISPQPQLPNLNFSSALNMNYFYLNNIGLTWTDFTRNTQFPSNVKSVKFYIRNWYYGNKILFDNLLLTLSDENSFDFDNTLEPTNLLKKSKWTQKMPLSVSYKEPVFYRELVDVLNFSKLQFSALIKGHDVKFPDRNFLGVEFYDAQYNILTDRSLISTLNYSDTSKFWTSPSFGISSINCKDYFEQDTNRSVAPNWYNNQWVKYNYTIDVPGEAKYLKLFLIRTSDIGDFQILNPGLYPSSQDSISSSVSNFINTKSENNLTNIVYPNPASVTINLTDEDFHSYNSLAISNTDGKILLSSKEIGKNINVSSLSKGIYFLNLYSENRNKTIKFIKN